MNPFPSLPPVPPIPPDRRAAMRRQLEAVVADKHGLVLWRRHPRLIAAGVIAIALSTAMGGVAYLQNAPVTNKASVRCYTAATYSPGRDFLGATVAEPAPAGSKGPGQVEDALAACTALWRQGFLVEGSKPVVPAQNTVAPVPALVVCTLSDGSAAVFPGDQGLCARLGLPAALPLPVPATTSTATTSP
jgi:hypothetical protein